MILTALTIALSMKFVGALIITSITDYSGGNGKTFCKKSGSDGDYCYFCEHDFHHIRINIISIL